MGLCDAASKTGIDDTVDKKEEPAEPEKSPYDVYKEDLLSQNGKKATSILIGFTVLIIALNTLKVNIDNINTKMNNTPNMATDPAILTLQFYAGIMLFFVAINNFYCQRGQTKCTQSRIKQKINSSGSFPYFDMIKHMWVDFRHGNLFVFFFMWVVYLIVCIVSAAILYLSDSAAPQTYTNVFLIILSLCRLTGNTLQYYTSIRPQNMEDPPAELSFDIECKETASYNKALSKQIGYMSIELNIIVIQIVATAAWFADGFLNLHILVTVVAFLNFFYISWMSAFISWHSCLFDSRGGLARIKKEITVQYSKLGSLPYISVFLTVPMAVKRGNKLYVIVVWAFFIIFASLDIISCGLGSYEDNSDIRNAARNGEYNGAPATLPTFTPPLATTLAATQPSTQPCAFTNSCPCYGYIDCFPPNCHLCRRDSNSQPTPPVPVTPVVHYGAPPAVTQAVIMGVLSLFALTGAYLEYNVRTRKSNKEFTETPTELAVVTVDSPINYDNVTVTEEVNPTPSIVSTVFTMSLEKEDLQISLGEEEDFRPDAKVQHQPSPTKSEYLVVADVPPFIVSTVFTMSLEKEDFQISLGEEEDFRPDAKVQHQPSPTKSEYLVVADVPPSIVSTVFTMSLEKEDAQILLGEETEI